MLGREDRIAMAAVAILAAFFISWGVLTTLRMVVKFMDTLRYLLSME